MRRSTEAASLAHRAYLEIRTGILSGRLALGSPISRRKLAESLGMSSVPITDALQRLESEGLVESWPRVGTRVRIPSVQDIRGHYVVREALESQAARLFSQKASPREREEIQRLAEKLDESYGRCNLTEVSEDGNFQLHEQHFHFHMRIAECSGHDALCEAIERNQILTFNWLFDAAADRKRFPARHHRELAEAICQSDPGKADSAMRAHVIYGCEDLLKRFESIYSPRLMQSRDLRPYDDADRVRLPVGAGPK